MTNHFTPGEIAAIAIAVIGNLGLLGMLICWPRGPKGVVHRCYWCNAELLNGVLCRNAFCPELRQERRRGA